MADLDFSALEPAPVGTSLPVPAHSSPGNGRGLDFGALQPTEGMWSSSIGLVNQLLGAFQQTTPVTHDKNGKPLYTSPGELINTDTGPMIDPGKGQKWLPVDAQKHVVFIGPDGQPVVYNRASDTDIGPLNAFGHLLGFGALAPSSAPLAGAAKSIPTASQQALRDFEHSGITPNLPATTGSTSAGLIAQGARNVPFAGAPVTGGIRRNLSEAAAAADTIASRYGASEGAEEGGSALQEGVAAFRGERAAKAPSLAEAMATPTRDMGFTNKAAALYDAIPIAPERPAAVTNSIRELTALKTKFASNPELGTLLQNPRFAKFAAALKPRTEETPAIMSRLVGASGNSIVKVPAQTVQKGGLSWGDLQDFRSFVGRQMRNPAGELGLGPDDWRALYGAASRDMETTAQSEGPAALKAFNRAKAYYSAGLDRINDALAIVEKADSPERAYANLMKTASVRGASADIGSLQRVMRSMPQEQRDEFAGAVVRRLGLPTKGAAGANPDNFSVGTFVSNYADMLDGAKDTIFGSAGTARRDSLDALARVLTRLRNVERLGNPSGTARGLIAGLGAYPLIAHPLETTAAFLSVYGGASALMSPRITRWLIGMNGVKSEAQLAGQMNRLRTIAISEPAARPLYDAMRYAAVPAAQPSDASAPQ